MIWKSPKEWEHKNLYKQELDFVYIYTALEICRQLLNGRDKAEEG